MSEAILRVTDIHASYSGSKVLHGLSFAIHQSDIVALIGRNGVGKTTCLKCLTGIVKPDWGEVSFLGEAGKSSIHDRANAGLAYVPQGRDIFSDFTVRENLMFGAVGAKKETALASFEKVMECFPSLEAHLGRKGGLLSGGQQQQLAIGRALMREPKLLLLDEPTEGIQPNIVSHIADILMRVHEEMKLPIIIVEQNLKFAMKYANRFLCMQKGSIVAEGTNEELTDEIIDKYLKV